MFPTAAKAFEMANLNQYGGKVCVAATDTGCCKTIAQLEATNGGTVSNTDVQNCMKINDPAAAYFNGGPIQMKTSGTYNYFSTRNNNFSNRSQKGILYVEPLLPTWGLVLASVGAAGFVGASLVAGGAYYGVTHPASVIATFFAGSSI